MTDASLLLLADAIEIATNQKNVAILHILLALSEQVQTEDVSVLNNPKLYEQVDRALAERAFPGSMHLMNTFPNHTFRFREGILWAQDSRCNIPGTDKPLICECKAWNPSKKLWEAV